MKVYHLHKIRLSNAYERIHFKFQIVCQILFAFWREKISILWWVMPHCDLMPSRPETMEYSIFIHFVTMQYMICMEFLKLFVETNVKTHLFVLFYNKCCPLTICKYFPNVWCNISVVITFGTFWMNLSMHWIPSLFFDTNINASKNVTC